MERGFYYFEFSEIMRGGVLLFLCKTFPIYPLNPYKTLKIPQNFRALRAKVEGGFYYFQDSEIQNLDRGFYYFQKFSNFGRGVFKKGGVSIINSPVVHPCHDTTNVN